MFGNNTNITQSQIYFLHINPIQHRDHETHLKSCLQTGWSRERPLLGLVRIISSNTLMIMMMPSFLSSSSTSNARQLDTTRSPCTCRNSAGASNTYACTIEKHMHRCGCRSKTNQHIVLNYFTKNILSVVTILL